MLATLLVLFIICFYLFFGCSYELVKCYNEPDSKDDEDEDDIEFEEDSERSSQIPNNRKNKSNDVEMHSPNVDQHRVVKQAQVKDVDDSCTCKKVTITILLILLGILLQPLYLFFYILFGMLECFRRYACWYFFWF